MIVTVLHHYHFHSQRPSPERSLWCKPRSKHWWVAVQNGAFGRGWWKENLHMSKDTFLFVCSKLRPYIEKQVVILRVMDCMHVILHCYTCRLLTSSYLFLLKKGLL